ncbi:nitrite reductase small subunit NirD [Staphylococcus edaphicus]|uniref:Nitrite reductase (NAD(P)H) small subunit n=2 Tax=Staphylococcus edaphicus TaxID=1955013 RepID=A0A2C6U701_9STAP|nr:nitrite reductase small subunit NirD [Staphylococcus edaphicus]PHK49602.1 nitrite reductase (NAD(P)H) small subunit [Staphylococcus edaphicus]UQW82036.1 nitrite reductase small subunit NirD [Staphylococcus edaphicus]
MTTNKVKVTSINELTSLIGKKMIIQDKEIGIFLTENGSVYAVNNICPHKQGPLSEGTVSGNHVYCPLHDQKVDLKTGELEDSELECVTVYDVEVHNGDVYLCL